MKTETGNKKMTGMPVINEDSEKDKKKHLGNCDLINSLKHNIV